MIKFLLLFLLTATSLTAREGYKYPYSDDASLSTYQERREKLIASLPKNSVVILLSADFFSGSGGFESENLFSQNLYYLSGMPQQKAVLLLIPGGFKIAGEFPNEILFLNNQAADDITWNGYRMGITDAEKYLKIKKVMDISLLDSILDVIVNDHDTIFFDMLAKTKHFLNGKEHTECDIELISKIKTNHPKLCLKFNIPNITMMRSIKDEEEIGIIQKAVDITIEGHKAVINSEIVGKTEYQLQAIMEYQFKHHGAERPAYGSIVGSGKNSCFLHYQNNIDTVRNGDLILLDCAAKYHGYCADITRTIPANGEFSIEQRIIYNIVLEAMDSAFAQCRRGNKFSLIHEKAKEVIAEKLLEQLIITNKDEVDKYFPHGTSHFIGLNVHESGSGDTLKVGNFLTIEPGIYIRSGSPCDNRWWNIGIRIEDNVLITDFGYINLSEKLPRKPEEIEEMMKKK